MRHHGGVTGTCIHGFAPGTCLICQTLDGAETKRGRTKASVTQRQVTPATTAPAVPAVASEHAATSRRRSGPRVLPEAPRNGSSPFKLAAVAVAVVAVVIVAWVALHVVFAVLRIVELIGVALIAGYLGWLAGVHRGRKDAGRRP